MIDVVLYNNERCIREMSKKWNVPVTELLDKSLEDAIKEKGYATKSEFIRNAVRKEIIS